MPSLVCADVGTGEFVRDVDVLSATKAQPMNEVGEDAIRFSTTPSLGGPAWIIELHADKRGRALGSVTFLYWVRDEAPLNVGTLQVGLSDAQYAKLAAQVDWLMHQPEPQPQTCGGRCLINICTDGAGLLTERRHDGVTTWMSGDCGNHPNNRIDRLMRAAVWRNFCELMPSPHGCQQPSQPRQRR
jgi:hypothetical protein